MQGGDILQQKQKLMMSKPSRLVVGSSPQVERVGGCLCKVAT